MGHLIVLIPEIQIKQAERDKLKREIIAISKEYKEKLDFLYSELRRADDDEKDYLYVKIKQTKDKRNEEVKELLSEEYVLYLILKAYEKETGENCVPCLRSKITP